MKSGKQPDLGATAWTVCRVCIVNNHGVVLMDKFARPKERVTDFRTRFSGIRPASIRGAPEFVDVQREAAELLKGRTIVGHSISNDLKVGRGGGTPAGRDGKRKKGNKQLNKCTRGGIMTLMNSEFNGRFCIPYLRSLELCSS